MQTPDAVTQAWMRQLDVGLRAIECLLEGATRMHEVQLEAATEAHADCIATHKALARAKDPAEALRLQTEWARCNAEKSMACWCSIVEAVMQTQAELAKCLAPEEKDETK